LSRAFFLYAQWYDRLISGKQLALILPFSAHEGTGLFMNTNKLFLTPQSAAAHPGLLPLIFLYAFFSEACALYFIGAHCLNDHAC